MIVIASTALGVVLGIRGAAKREGNRLDKAQWGAGYGIAFALIGLILTIIIERLSA